MSARLLRLGVLLALVGCGDPPTTSLPPDAAATGDTDPLEGEPDNPVDTGRDARVDPIADPSDDPDAGTDPDPGDVNLPDVPGPRGLEIIAISPEGGPVGGGTDVLIVGLNFTPLAEVLLGGVPCEAIDVVDETKITCRTPLAAAPGRVALKVVTEADEATLPEAFEYLPELSVELIEPDFGPTTGGMPLLIHGRGFGADTQVSIGGRSGLAVERIDAGTIQLLSPPGSAGPAVVQVSDVHGLVRLEAAFDYLEPPRVDHILPGAGEPAGGGLVELLGTGLAPDLVSVHFGLVEAEVIEAAPDRLLVVAPPGPRGEAVDVTVTMARAGAWTTPGGFHFWDAPVPPALLHVSPTLGPVSGGTVVAISGIGLGDASEVRFGSTSAELLVVSERYLLVEAPPAGAPGSRDLAVELPAGWRLLEDAFEYLPDLAVTAVEPDRGDVAGGNIVRLQGTGFASGMTVHIGPLPLANVQVAGPTELTGTTPPGAPGAADVRVRSPRGLVAMAPAAYTYTATPAVQGFHPPRGSWAGGTRVLIRGRALLEPVEVAFGAEPAALVEWLDPSTVAAWTPRANSEAFVDLTVRSGGGDWLTAPGRFLYFDPQNPTPGVWGEAIDGAVNVTVVGERGNLLADAFVMLGVRDAPTYAGYTDGQGQVTLSGPGLAGPQTVSASRVGFSASMLVDVEGENVTLALRCAHDGPCVADGDCRGALVCEEGACIDASCGGGGFGGNPSPFATVTGQLDGLDKIGDPGPDELLLAAVYISTDGPWSLGSVRPNATNVLLENGPYTLPSRIGALAVVAVCGMYNQVTQTFRPIRMGIRRGLFLSDQQVATVDLTCDIWMDATLSLKALASPLGPAGPTLFRHVPFLELGEDGYFGGQVILEGTEDVLSMTAFAPLEGPLADASYYVRGGAYNGTSWPYSITSLGGIRAIDDVVVLPSFVTVAHLTTPPPDSAEPLAQGYLEWSTPTSGLPDLWRIQIRDFGGYTWWDVSVPGDTTRVNLPAWPAAGEVGLFPSGPMFLLFRGLDAEPFDPGDYDEADLAGALQGRFSISAYTIVNP